MKGYFYIYDEDDNRLPKSLVEHDWSRTKILREHENKFDSYEEAQTWRSIYNHCYISRAPYVVHYNCGLNWEYIEMIMHANKTTYLPDMMSWFIRRFANILDVSRETICRDKKMEFFRYVKDVLQFKGDDNLLKGIIMQLSNLEINYLSK